jgi:hypothetical protein
VSTVINNVQILEAAPTPRGQGRRGRLRRRARQAHHETVLQAQRPAVIGVQAGAVPLPGGVEIRALDNAAQVAGAGHLHQAPGPVPVRTVVVGGMPGWQIALIAAAAALIAATVAVLADRARTARRKSATAAA